MRHRLSRRAFVILGLITVGWKWIPAAFARERIPVESSSIASVGYDVAARVLEVEFKNGGLYRYRDVPREIFDGLMSAASKGRYFIERIRVKFDCERVKTAAP